MNSRAMTLSGVGRFSERTVTVKGKKYKQYVIFVPKLVALDSAFPFKPGDRVLIKIEGNRVVVEPVE